MSRTVKAVTRLKGRSAFAKLDQASYVVARMTGNANFPTLADQVTALGTAMDALKTAITNANSGDHEAVGLKQLLEEQVVELLAMLCDSVNGIAAGNKALLLTTGFPLRRDNKPAGPLPPPQKVAGRYTQVSGGAKLEWDGNEHARMYNVYMSTTAEPFAWQLVGTSTKRRYEPTGLTPGTFYWFSITAVGTAGESSKSEPAMVMAAA